MCFQNVKALTFVHNDFIKITIHLNKHIFFAFDMLIGFIEWMRLSIRRLEFCDVFVSVK